MDKRAAKRIAGLITDRIEHNIDAFLVAEAIAAAADANDHTILAWRNEYARTRVPTERDTADLVLIRAMARRTEGLTGAEIDRREAERWVAVLAATLALVKPQTKYLWWSAPDVAPVDIQERIARDQEPRAADRANLARGLGVDGSVARWPRPPHNDVYLGHTDEFADAYARGDILVLFGGEPDEDPRERTYVPRHDDNGSRVARGSALYHQHLATIDGRGRG
jgi:hypothetical protein